MAEKEDFIYEEYELLDGSTAIKKITSDTIYSIPKDPSNADYQQYLRWLENANK